MAATPSTMLNIGTEAPNFELLDPITGATVSLSQIKGEAGMLVMFICNHCPYVKHLANELARLGEDYIPRGIGFAAINSNDVETYPEDSPEKMVEESQRRGYPFPYLFDQTQEVAHLYQAACTPDFFLFDADLTLVYRGQFDDSRPGNNLPVTGKDLRMAMENLISGEPISQDQKPSIGCNIKWKK
ncbi:MAG: thioredoxin family protein [Ignavibacteriae bacterium]|nr:thioredoxin family protein [Ignavibacteriota bacterium]MCB9217516.1 thioredoxin family protein [Ignavibacteria bacterium]